jgi:hypothetical protein
MPKDRSALLYVETIIRRYFTKRPDPQLLQDHVDAQMQAYDQTLKNDNDSVQSPDPDGFLTIRHSRKHPIADPQADGECRRRMPRTVDDFYRFQLRKRARSTLSAARLGSDATVLSTLRTSGILRP